jgi:hypothetical protein
MNTKDWTMLPQGDGLWAVWEHAGTADPAMLIPNLTQDQAAEIVRAGGGGDERRLTRLAMNAAYGLTDGFFGYGAHATVGELSRSGGADEFAVAVVKEVMGAGDSPDSALDMLEAMWRRLDAAASLIEGEKKKGELPKIFRVTCAGREAPSFVFAFDSTAVAERSDPGWDQLCSVMDWSTGDFPGPGAPPKFLVEIFREGQEPVMREGSVAVKSSALQAGCTVVTTPLPPPGPTATGVRAPGPPIPMHKGADVTYGLPNWDAPTVYVDHRAEGFY